MTDRPVPGPTTLPSASPRFFSLEMSLFTAHLLLTYGSRSITLPLVVYLSPLGQAGPLAFL